jgi:hypothetical protein
LNTVGGKVVDEVVIAVAAQTGMPNEIIRRNIAVTHASAQHLVYRIDASQALIESPENRPMKGRGFARRSDDYFHSDELVKIVTFGDEKVCQICQDAEADGPYKIDEARAMLPLHPHCRCLVESFRSRRQLPVTFRKGKSVEVGKITIAKLQEELGKEIKISLRAL